MKDTMKTVGVWAFMVGVVLALIAGVLASNLSAYMGLISIVMVVLGLVVGALNISDKEVTGCNRKLRCFAWRNSRWHA